MVVQLNEILYEIYDQINLLRLFSMHFWIHLSNWISTQLFFDWIKKDYLCIINVCFLVGRNHLYSIDLKFSLQFSENTQLFLVFISHFQSSQEILNWELVASMFVLPPTRLDSHVKTVIELSEFHFMPSSPIFLLNHSNFTKSSTAIGIADCSLGYNTSTTFTTNNKVL